MKKIVWGVLVSLCCTACFQKVEQAKDSLGGNSVDYEVSDREEKKETAAKIVAREAAEDSTDWLHQSLVSYPCVVEWLETDTICHYPENRKLRIGHHGGRALSLELGEFFDNIDYDGAKIYWGDSLIYATELAVINDWQTCRVYHVPDTDVTYVLILIDGRPAPNYWHILYMDAERIRLIDYVLAGNDYVPGAHYFHDNIIFGDIDEDNVLEVGGKNWTEIWADSMIYQPCYIYELGQTVVMDSVTSKAETIKANNGLFLGFKGGEAVYNPNKEQHEREEE